MRGAASNAEFDLMPRLMRRTASNAELDLMPRLMREAPSNAQVNAWSLICAVPYGTH
jgi:hypothetical protein